MEEGNRRPATRRASGRGSLWQGVREASAFMEAPASDPEAARGHRPNGGHPRAGIQLSGRSPFPPPPEPALAATAGGRPRLAADDEVGRALQDLPRARSPAHRRHHHATDTDHSALGSPRCGSRLLDTSNPGGPFIEIRLGSLDEAPFELKPEHETWVKRRESWLPPVESAAQHDEN